MIFLLLFCILLTLLVPSLGIHSNPTPNRSKNILRRDVSPIFETIARDSGLSNLSVSSIFQDKYGFMWFGTQGGLNKYNSREMEVIANQPFVDDGLIHNLIQTMYYDRENHEIWIGTYQGVSQYDIAKQKFTNYTVKESGLSNPVVIAITKDSNGIFWIGTMDGLNKLIPTTGEITTYNIPGSVIRDLKVDSSGRLLIASHEGLLFYDQQSDEIVIMDIQLPVPIVMDIEEFDPGILTVGLWEGGIAQYNTKTKTLNHIRFDDNRVYKILKTNDGTLWAGTSGGGLFAILPNGDISQFMSGDGKYSLAHPVIYSLYQDQSDILWIGTNGGGISKVSPRKVNHVILAHNPDDTNSLSQGKINRIIQDQNGDMWFAIYNRGLNRYTIKEKKITKYCHLPGDLNSLPANQVMDMIPDGKSNLLFGTNAGLVNYDLLNNQFSLWDTLSGIMIYAIEKISDTEYWIGTYDQGIYYYNQKNGFLKNYCLNNENLLSSNLVYDILKDSKGRLWVGTNNGLNKMDPGNKHFTIYYKAPDDYTQLSSNTIHTVFEDSRGRIWIGTVGGGIAQFNEESDTFTSYTEQNGMPNNVISGILEDNDGRIWASTSNGLAIINPDTGEISGLTPDDGIGGWEFNIGHCRDKEGNLYFGGIHGITVIPNKLAEIMPHQPKIYITDVELYQKSVDKKRIHFNNAELSFGPNDKFLGFRFVALDYDSPYKVTYYYKLEGFDKERVWAGTRTYASYSNLPPGKYRLAVWAETSRRVQTDPVYLHISISPPWYNTIPAYIAYFIIFALIVISILKIREGYLVNKQNSILEIINKKLEKANSQLENLSTRDSLTGVFNRRYFNIVAEERLQLAKRSNAYLSLIMFDIDHFKQVNDRFGHLTGDKLLAKMGSEMSKILVRKTDFLARLGGDEFIVVLYDTDKTGAEIVALQMKDVVENILTIDELQSSFKVTISIGVTSLIPGNGTSLEEILKTADSALYCAKNNGRNCICIKDLHN